MLPALDTARRFLDSHAPPHTVAVGVTGSHFYGFPSPDSDLDLKGVHIAPTSALLGLHPPKDTFDYLGPFENQEIDFTSHEVGLALRLLLQGNGNILERILSPLQLCVSAEQQLLRELAASSLSRRFSKHYRGFFHQSVLRVRKSSSVAAKLFLYAYRPALTGIHLLTTGQCVGDVSTLASVYSFPAVQHLIDIKCGAAELAVAPPDVQFDNDVERLETMLASAEADSSLPESPTNVAAISAALVDLRRRWWD